MISVKIHSSYREVIAICDSDLIGKKFEQDIRQLEIRESFFKGTELNHEEAIKLMREQIQEDSTFNIVGPKSIKAALDARIISKEGISKIQGVPFALVLL